MRHFCEHGCFMAEKKLGQYRLTVVLEKNISRKPGFDQNHFELPDMDKPECKANFMI